MTDADNDDKLRTLDALLADIDGDTPAPAASAEQLWTGKQCAHATLPLRSPRSPTAVRVPHRSVVKTLRVSSHTTVDALRTRIVAALRSAHLLDEREAHNAVLSSCDNGVPVCCSCCALLQSDSKSAASQLLATRTMAELDFLHNQVRNARAVLRPIIFSIAPQRWC